MINWINVKNKLPKTFEHVGRLGTWAESDVVLVKLEGTLELPFGFATLEIDEYSNYGTKSYWIDEVTRCPYSDDVKVVAWASLSELY